MEDKQYYKDELQKLGIEDLGSVAGGYTMEQLTEEEIKRAHELDVKWKKAASDVMAGKISDDEYDAITNEYKAFIRMLLKKYDGIDN
jgi:hypothetical protein